MWIKIGSNMRVSLKYHDNKLTSTTTHLRGMPVFAHDFKMVMEKKKKCYRKKSDVNVERYRLCEMPFEDGTMI